MLYLLMAVVSSAMVSILMRTSEKYVHSTMVMFCANYAACMVLSLIYTGDMRPLIFESGTGITAALGTVTGFLYLAAFLLLQKNINCNGVIFSGAMMKLGGVLVPTIAAVLLFQERMKWLQLAGIVLAVAAILLINIEKGGLWEGGRKQWLVILLIVSGFADTMTNIFDKTGPSILKNLYLLCTFFVALLIAFAFALRKKQQITTMTLLCGLLIGIPNYYSTRFLLLSLERVPAVVAYPVFSVGTLIVISITGAVFFHERLGRRKQAALLLILASLVLLTVS